MAQIVEERPLVMWLAALDDFRNCSNGPRAVEKRCNSSRTILALADPCSVRRGSSASRGRPCYLRDHSLLIRAVVTLEGGAIGTQRIVLSSR
jgi:hypothetical protein